jgi:hypothetical protein
MVAQDLITFGIGIGLIVRQGWFVDPSQINPWVLVFAGTLINVPAATQLLSRTPPPGTPHREPESSFSPMSSPEP